MITTPLWHDALIPEVFGYFKYCPSIGFLDIYPYFYSWGNSETKAEKYVMVKGQDIIYLWVKIFFDAVTNQFYTFE